jgi:hypothetical protein
LAGSRRWFDRALRSDATAELVLSSALGIVLPIVAFSAALEVFGLSAWPTG